MIDEKKALHRWSLRCLQCHGALTSEDLNLGCRNCGSEYPVISGIPILVRGPLEYLRSELTSLGRVSREARQRRESLEILKTELGLPPVSVDRHRNIIETEIARIDSLLALLEPPASAPADDRGLLPSAHVSGWTLEALVPFLLRDWTQTTELEDIKDRIGVALRRAFGDFSEKSAVFPGCGAAGLLAKLAPEFGQILGFDLTLPALRAARDLLDGKTLDLALPRMIHPAGHVILRGDNNGSAEPPVMLAAMDAFNTAFADGSVDCVVTAFLLDLMPAPRGLASEIHRILRDGGVWINYGPSGPLKALWRFDQNESAAFLETAGFSVIEADAYRTTHLDVSRDFPSWSFQNHVCYLTSARKTGHVTDTPTPTTPGAAEIPQIVPHHFPGAQLIQRQRLGTDAKPTTVLRHERYPSRPQTMRVSNEAARLVALVDGQRTVAEIAQMFIPEMPGVSVPDIIQAFSQYFEEGLLDWRGQKGR
ncbi:MAG: methyltransferase domain-containing protein [Alphaproteobacteria bacterium]